MKSYLLIALGLLLFGASAFGQGNYVLNDPAAKPKAPYAGGDLEKMIRANVVPKLRKLWSEDACPDGLNLTGMAKGAFTKAGANQTLVFFEFCQTGNGFGNNGLALIENDKVVPSFASEGGWPIDLVRVPDITQNGVDEFLMYYSGGMHQGMGGSGAELMEFSGGALKCMGWFQADSFGEPTGDFSYKVTVKPGKQPVFYRQKYIEGRGKKWRAAGKATPLALRKKCFEFTSLN